MSRTQRVRIYIQLDDDTPQLVGDLGDFPGLEDLCDSISALAVRLTDRCTVKAMERQFQGGEGL